MEHTQLGRRIRRARENMDYSQKQFAQFLGVKVSTVERWESEQLTPRVNQLNTISGVLAVPVIWLMAGADQLPEGDSNESNHVLIEQKIATVEQNLGEIAALMGEIKLLMQSEKIANKGAAS